MVLDFVVSIDFAGHVRQFFEIRYEAHAHIILGASVYHFDWQPIAIYTRVYTWIEL